MTAPKTTAPELADELHRAAREQRVTGHVTSYSSETLDHFAAELARLAEVEKVARRVIDVYVEREKTKDEFWDWLRLDNELKQAIAAARSALSSTTNTREGWQARVIDWMRRCFVHNGSITPEQRSFRFVEEALELAQAIGTSRDEVTQLVDYVYSRPVGTPTQEIGGVMVTLAGVASSISADVDACLETELARCEANIEKIRAKDLSKPERAGLLPALSSTADKGEGE